MKKRRILAVASALAVAALAITGCSSNGGGKNSDGSVTLTFRTWDTNAQAAYEQSFADFTKANPNIKVKVDVVPWSDYFTKLRTDIAGNSAADLFWINSSNYLPYAKSGGLLDVSKIYGDKFDSAKGAWESAVVKQFTDGGTLYGIPQLSDGGIAVYYNADLLKKAGLTVDDISKLKWAPGVGASDNLVSTLQKLTLDKSGKNAADPGFDANNIAQYGYNAANDLQAIYLPFIGSNGGTFQDGENFTLTNPKTVEAFQYIVDLINKYHVAPSAADTNDNGDFSRDQFLQGKMALFQSGLYNLSNVSNSAKFEWGTVMLPAGPAGAITVTNGVAVAANAKSKNPDAVKKVMQWLGSAEGNAAIGSTGANLPGVTAAQQGYKDFWKAKNVNLDPFFDVLKIGKTIPAPFGTNFGAASTAYTPIFNEMFLGQQPVSSALKKADDAANAAVKG